MLGKIALKNFYVSAQWLDGCAQWLDGCAQWLDGCAQWLDGSTIIPHTRRASKGNCESHVFFARFLNREPNKWRGSFGDLTKWLEEIPMKGIGYQLYEQICWRQQKPKQEIIRKVYSWQLQQGWKCWPEDRWVTHEGLLGDFYTRPLRINE